MNKSHLFCHIWTVFSFVLFSFSMALAGPAAVTEPKDIPALSPAAEQSLPLQEIGAGVYALGEIRIYVREGRIEFPAQINMSEGLLEYLLVGEQGKVHESLLVTPVHASNLQIALLMLGLEGSKNPLTMQGEARIPEGSPVRIQVRLRNEQLNKMVAVEQWIANRTSGQAMDPMDWIFTGSIIDNGQFMAQVEKSLVAIFHDPIAIIDNPLQAGANDEFWNVNKATVPPVGTEVTVLIQKVKKG